MGTHFGEATLPFTFLPTIQERIYSKGRRYFLKELIPIQKVDKNENGRIDSIVTVSNRFKICWLTNVRICFTSVWSF